MQYSAHDSHVAPARLRPQPWRLLVGLIVTVVVYGLGIALTLLALLLISGPDGAERWMIEMTEATGPTGTLMLLGTFVFMALGPFIAVRLLHRRPIGTLLGPPPRVIKHFVAAAVICAGVYGLASLLPFAAQASPNLDTALWLSFLPLALVGVLIQTGAEEILFRGYIQQQLAARFASPVVWMILPSAVFALLHYQPGIMGGNAWLIVAAVGLFALLAADLTARTGSLGAAWGFHFANNVVAILIVSLDGPLSGLALHTAQVSAADASIRPLILLDMATTLVTWAVIRAIVPRID